METYINKLSNNAQIIFARILQRKRKWYTVSDHLQKYAGQSTKSRKLTTDKDDLGNIGKAIDELLEHGFLVEDLSLVDDIVKGLKDEGKA